MLHAIARASERWDLKLTVAGLEAINGTYNSKTLQVLGRTPRNGARRLICFLISFGRKMPVVWDAETKTIATFLPTAALEEIEQTASAEQERQRTAARERNTSSQVLKRPYWMSEERFTDPNR